MLNVVVIRGLLTLIMSRYAMIAGTGGAIGLETRILTAGQDVTLPATPTPRILLLILPMLIIPMLIRLVVPVVIATIMLIIILIMDAVLKGRPI
jgi:hypothetical protein